MERHRSQEKQASEGQLQMFPLSTGSNPVLTTKNKRYALQIKSRKRESTMEKLYE
jgi:hypothetical protein